MSLAQPIGSEAEPDYEPDVAALMLIELQMKHLIELRGLAMDVARDIASASTPANAAAAHPDLAMARIGKLILQIVVIEQQTVGLRDKRRAELKNARSQAKKDEAKREVIAALAAGKPTLPPAQRDNLLRGIFMNYDISDPRQVAQIVADMCRQLGVPPRPDIWPAGEPAAPESAVEESPAAEGGACDQEAPVAPDAVSGMPHAAVRPASSPGDRPIGTQRFRPRANGRAPP